MYVHRKGIKVTKKPETIFMVNIVKETLKQ